MPPRIIHIIGLYHVGGPYVTARAAWATQLNGSNTPRRVPIARKEARRDR